MTITTGNSEKSLESVRGVAEGHIARGYASGVAALLGHGEGSHVVTFGNKAVGAADFSLLAMAGHDLRQPLRLITSAHDVLAQTLDSEQQREELARAEDATAQLASMLGQLVDALQLRERSGDDLHLPVPLRPILEDLAEEFAEMARLKGITFVVITAACGTALSHPVLLAGMLRNLIRNAIDYTSSGGGVFVTSRRCGSELRISVRDTGVGIWHQRAVGDLHGVSASRQNPAGRSRPRALYRQARRRSARAPRRTPLGRGARLVFCHCHQCCPAQLAPARRSPADWLIQSRSGRFAGGSITIGYWTYPERKPSPVN